ncbi:MAG TPA: DnaJ domain-containing protein [Alphaproteobacteria bacterium]
MPLLILGVAIAIGIVLIAMALKGTGIRQGLVNALPSLRWTAAALLGVLAVFLIVTGREGPAFTLLFVVLPLVLRWRTLQNVFKGMRGPTPGKATDIETRTLRMRLDHDTGALEGTVLDGPFRGRTLAELSREELLALLRDCRADDPESAPLVESYLDRVHGADWRTGDSGPRSQSGASGPTRGPMTRDEAYKVLGLNPGATADEIHEAHRRLMLKIHPDQGGSTYLAAQINQAKDLLLGG